MLFAIFNVKLKNTLQSWLYDYHLLQFILYILDDIIGRRPWCISCYQFAVLIDEDKAWNTAEAVCLGN